jgi:hypothetical protein
MELKLARIGVSCQPSAVSDQVKPSLFAFVATTSSSSQQRSTGDLPDANG